MPSYKGHVLLRNLKRNIAQRLVAAGVSFANLTKDYAQNILNIIKLVYCYVDWVSTPVQMLVHQRLVNLQKLHQRL